MTTLRHKKDLQQIHDKMQFTENCTKKLRQSYKKTYNSSNRNVKHVCSNYFDFSLVYAFHIRP